MENFVVLTWLRLLHPELPKLVKQRYGTELRARTLASIKPEISQALDSLLEELRTSEDAKAMRTAVNKFSKPTNKQHTTAYRSRSCPLCKTAGRPDNHFLSKCTFLPLQDRQFMAKARAISEIHDVEDLEDSTADSIQPVSSSRIQVRQSPYVDTFHGHIPVRLTIDSGATGNMMRASTATKLNAKITGSSQFAHQADGSSPLTVLGETRLHFTRGGHKLYFEGLVVENLDTEVLAGIPFMEMNDISIRPSSREVCIGNKYVYTYGSSASQTRKHTVRRAHIAQAPPQSVTLWPGDFIEVDLPEDMLGSDNTFSVEPHSLTDKSVMWPEPCIVSDVSGKIRIPNTTASPLVLRRNEHLCQVRTTFVPEPTTCLKLTPTRSGSSSVFHSDAVRVDPDSLLPVRTKRRFEELLHRYDNVFNPLFSGYNGAVGPLEAKVNMGPVQPPQRKGRVPQYSKDQLCDLQEMFNELENIGVFKRPEDLGISVEYINPSFLVKKPSGGFRLVTAFADVGRYSKPQPSLMPDVDSTLRQIAQWQYIIISDLTKSFYQIPLSRDSMKYCGVVTPFQGVRVYVRSAIGMPGSETALEELTCRVLGHLVQEGVVAKIADDLYCGGHTPEELLNNWERVLIALHKCSLNLSASKTIIAPKDATILGWHWHLGTIQANPHRIATLASCQPPKTVTALRSFIGSYKVLSRVIKNSSDLIAPLEDIIAGGNAKDTIAWNDELHAAFDRAQKALSTHKAITLPRPSDQLWIVTDGALRKLGLGATLYVGREGKPLLAGFFSAKLRPNQRQWLPCEIEALAIAAAIKHYSPFIIQSKLSTCVLTDSKPCVQAYEKLCRGEFSTSPRVSTFLATASRFQVSIRHVSGQAILPSDFASRNAPDCSTPSCQICNFIHLQDYSVVRHITTQDVLRGKIKLPFTSRAAWLSIQNECPNIRRTIAHLRQGTRPSKKITNIRDVKRYLNVASLARDGLLVVKKQLPFTPYQECIVIPRQILDGLLTSLHIKLDHPSCHQLKNVVSRYFYALDLEKAVELTTNTCHQCASLLKTPKVCVEQGSSDPPETVGSTFAADVLKRERQLILVIRECVTSFTFTKLIESERHLDLRDAIIQLLAEVHPLDGPFAVIRTDPASGFKALVSDQLLARHRLSIELGRVKNPNKNPVAERAIQELEDEALRSNLSNSALTPLSLSLITARLNTRIRSRGLSSREMWTQRDQFSNNQLPVADHELILSQQELRQKNHIYSERAKCPSGRFPALPNLCVGDVVYLRCDLNKSKSRDRYLVAEVDPPWCNIRKFAGNQLRQTSYRVKYTDCYKVTSDYPEVTTKPTHSHTDEDDQNPEDLQSDDVPHSPSLPAVPSAISEVPSPQQHTPIIAPNPAVDLTETPDNCGTEPAALPVDSEFNTEEPIPSDLPDRDTVVTRPSRRRTLPKKFDEFVMF